MRKITVVSNLKPYFGLKFKIHPVGAHTMSHVTGLAWLNETELLSVGHDSNVKVWKIDAAK